VVVGSEGFLTPSSQEGGVKPLQQLACFMQVSKVTPAITLHTPIAVYRLED
jgi:hypothetical protein